MHGKITKGGGGIHVSVYMHAKGCTMIVQNDNAQGGEGAQNPQGGGGGEVNAPPPPPN